MIARPLIELRSFLSGLLPGLRQRRDFGTMLKVEVAQEITAEVVTATKQASDLAYKAEQADHEAARIIGLVLADGRVTPEELPLLTKALANINRSAGHDRTLADALAIPA